jgi:hypothetical protein
VFFNAGASTDFIEAPVRIKKEIAKILHQSNESDENTLEKKFVLGKNN